MVQPAANEGEVQQRPPLIRGRFFSLGGTKRRRGVGRWWCFTPLFATESDPTATEPVFKPRLRFVPRFLLWASPLWPPKVTYGYRLHIGSPASALSGYQAAMNRR